MNYTTLQTNKTIDAIINNCTHCGLITKDPDDTIHVTCFEHNHEDDVQEMIGRMEDIETFGEIDLFYTESER